MTHTSTYHYLRHQHDRAWAAIKSTRVSRTWVFACHPKGLLLTLKANSDPRFEIRAYPDYPRAQLLRLKPYL